MPLFFETIQKASERKKQNFSFKDGTHCQLYIKRKRCDGNDESGGKEDELVKRRVRSFFLLARCLILLSIFCVFVDSGWKKDDGSNEEGGEKDEGMKIGPLFCRRFRNVAADNNNNNKQR